MENLNPDKSSSMAFLAKVDTTLVAWLVFLVFGGGIISLYYARIHYLPDIEWSTSIVHLAVATFVGGAITILLGLSLYIPGYIWSELLMFDERLKHAFCLHPFSNDLCLKTLGWYIGIPFWVALMLNHVALIVFPYFMSEESLEGERLLVAYSIISLFTLVGVSFFIVGNFYKLLQLANSAAEQVLDPKEESQRVFRYVAWFALSVVLGQVAMIFIYLFSRRPTGTPFILTTIACGLGALVSNHLVALHYHFSRLQSVIAALVTACLLLVVADHNESFSSRVLSFYGVGDRSETVDLLLDDDGGKILKDLGLTDTCPNSPPNKLCDVYVLSRLGNEYYLERKDRKFTLPKVVVRSRTPSH